MAAQNLILLFSLAMIFVATSAYYPPPLNAQFAAAKNQSHTVVIGYRQPGDRLVYAENIVKKSSFLQVVSVVKTFNTTKFERITQVVARDNKTNGNGAYASLQNGGPGYTNVTIRFKSQRGHGINFTVELYAR